MDRDASGAGLSFPECADSPGIAWQPKQYVLTKNTFFSTIADLLVCMLTTITDPALRIAFPSSAPCPLLLMFVIIHPHVPIFNLIYLIRNAVC